MAKSRPTIERRDDLKLPRKKNPAKKRATLPETVNHRGMIEELAHAEEGPCGTAKVKLPLTEFFNEYCKGLVAYVAAKLRGPAKKRQDDAEEHFAVFVADQIRRMSEGKKTVFSIWDGQRSFRGLLKGACWKLLLQRRGVRPGTAKDYERFRDRLEDYVRSQVGAREMPAALAELVKGNIPDYVQLFLDYYASRQWVRLGKKRAPSPKPERSPGQDRIETTGQTPEPQQNSPDEEWFDKLQARCWTYVEWYLLRPDFPAWDYLRYRQDLLANERVRATLAAAVAPAAEISDAERLVDEFLTAYGGQNLRVTRPHEEERGGTPLRELQVRWERYVSDSGWRERYRKERARGVERVRKRRPLPQRGVENGFDEANAVQATARRGADGDGARFTLYAEPGCNRAQHDAPALAARYNRQWFNQTALEVIARYLAEQGEGSKFVKLLKARALQPYSEGRRDPPYKEFCDQCGFPGETIEERTRRAQLAWSHVQDGIKSTLLREFEDRAAKIPDPDFNKQHWVEQQMDEFYRLLHVAAREFGIGRNSKDQDDLRRYVGELSGRPGLSGSSAHEIALGNCSLDIIAVLLIEAPPERNVDDRRREWQDQMSLRLSEIVPPPQAETSAWRERTLGQLIHAPKPPVDLLIAAKDAFRERYQATDSKADPDTPMAAYLSCIAVALARTGTKITRKSRGELEDDLRWLADAEWLDDETRQLAKTALDRVPAPGAEKATDATATRFRE